MDQWNSSEQLFRLRKFAHERPEIDQTHVKDDAWWCDLYDTLHPRLFRDNKETIQEERSKVLSSLTGADFVSLLPSSSREAVNTTIKEKEEQFDPDAFAIRKGLKVPFSDPGQEPLMKTVAATAAEAAAPYIDLILLRDGDDHATRVLMDRCKEWLSYDHLDDHDVPLRLASIVVLLKGYSDVLNENMTHVPEEKRAGFKQLLKRGLLAPIGLTVHLDELECFRAFEKFPVDA